MLTNRTEVIDDVMVMSAGADDYISKPINTKILVARVNQQIARGQSQRAPRANQLVDTHASRLRKKIREGGGPEVITVIRSVGFRLSDAAKPFIEV